MTSVQLNSIRLRRGLIVPQEPPLTPTTLRQLSRLTVSVEDVTEAQQLTASNDTLQQFDIIAATPGNIKVFAHLCKQSDIDIICLDFTHRQSFPINKKLVIEDLRCLIFLTAPLCLMRCPNNFSVLVFITQLDCAVQRGISFEIVYAPLFQGDSFS